MCVCVCVLTVLCAAAEYGGVYLDGDTWVLRSLDDLRQYPATVGEEDKGQRICNALMLAEPDAAFVHRWYDGFVLIAVHSGLHRVVK